MKAFCINCGERRDFTIGTFVGTATVNDTTFMFEEKKAFCAVCGQEIYTPFTNDTNALNARQSFQKALGANP